MSSPVMRSALSWLVTLLIPVVLVLTAVRLMFTPLYLQFEYNAPGFPPDSYGFTTQDRLYWAPFALNYLLNSSDINYLGDLRFKDGAAVYNERELRHMVDVKNTVRAALQVWTLSLALLILFGVWAWRGGWWDEFGHAVGRGGWLTILLFVGVLAFVFFGFDAFFVAFHNVFFQPGTWMFLWSDTLIRLFPERFWRDIFVLVGAMTIGFSLAAVYLFRRK